MPAPKKDKEAKEPVAEPVEEKSSNPDAPVEEPKAAGNAAAEAKAAAKAEQEAGPVGGIAQVVLEATGRTLDFTERNFGPRYREEAQAHAAKLAESGQKVSIR